MHEKSEATGNALEVIKVRRRKVCAEGEQEAACARTLPQLSPLLTEGLL